MVGFKKDGVSTSKIFLEIYMEFMHSPESAHFCIEIGSRVAAN